MAKTYIGTSGWDYQHWMEAFYPSGTDREEFLTCYAERFGTVEINATFYRLPSEQTMASWRDAVPDEFVFTVKASRYLTHMKKLKDPEDPLEKVLQRARILQRKLGPVLFQLPPNWRFDEERLAAFLELLPDDLRAVLEFRDERWFSDRAFELLRQANAALCMHDLGGKATPRVVTADFAFIRLHGPGEAYRGSYDEHDLSGWAGAISSWTRQGKDVYCYFNNDEAGNAPKNALALERMLE